MTTSDLNEEREDWSLEILQALVQPSSPDDAAMACAAAWVNFCHAEHAVVVVFDAPDSCIVAEGRQTDDSQWVDVGRHRCSFATLLHPESLLDEPQLFSLAAPDLILCWPEHFSVVLLRIEETDENEQSISLIENVSRRLLSRWTTPQTSFADPDLMEAMAEFAAGAGHEINNPLGSIIGQSQLLLKQTDQPDIQQSVETIGAQAWRIRDMIGDTMLFARPPQPEFTVCRLDHVCQDVVSKSAAASAENRQLVLLAPDDRVSVFADQDQVTRLVSCLTRNALESVADQPEGRVTLTIARESDYAAAIRVIDNGPPVPDLIRRHMFNPFFSGRQAGRGLGFGLCHCWQIARMHNGLLSYQPLDDGNQFTVLLPTDHEEEIRST